MSTPVPKTAVGKSVKPKSPAAPSRGLKESLTDVRIAYDRYSHAEFSRGELASALDVSATSGPFTSRLFTLKEYGLLDGAGDKLKVSALYKRLHGAPEGSTGFKRAAVDAINRAGVFKTVLGEFGQKVPAAETIANRLEMQHHFNKDRAQLTAKTLRDSLTFAGVLDRNGNVLTPRGADDESDDVGGAEGNGVQDPLQGKSARENARDTAPAPKNALTLEVPLENGRIVRVLYPNDLSGSEASKVGKVIAALVG